ncbi:uncharacterized protein LOC131225266 [Magnolia sinica]|uniref:uncharacterized protein LOC131225266 n=1 Tax=Magnolia sinica TaxID=86752 RepID=UPI0026596C05|nr:uncharacterized protein LOC131225266 [Magnolia sinica]
MYGSGSFPMARNHANGDRFYNPPAIRRQLQQQQQRQQQRPLKTRLPPPVSEARETENRAESDDLKASVCSLPPEPRLPSGNLDRFLESTTPIVPAQYFSKTSMRGWRNCDAELYPYFSLGDLWESFKEWSVYGAGVPLVLNGSDSVVQYYVPYLSGIQLYVDSSSKPTLSLRRPGEESDGDSSRDTSSDGSSDCDVDRSKQVGESTWSHHNPMDPSILRINRLSLRDKPHLVGQEGFSSDDGEVSNPHGILTFEYFEQDPPYSREPLADKASSFFLGT